MRVRGEAGHNGLTRLAEVVREAGHLVTCDPRVDEQHPGPALHDDCVVLERIAPMNQYTLRNLRQHGWAPPARGRQPTSRRWPVNRIASAVGDGSMVIA
jgi:hypothetical protein